MTYQNNNSKYSKPFTPKKLVRSFRDLDVYQRMMECAVIITKDLKPILVRFGTEEDIGKKGKGKGSTSGNVGTGTVKYDFLENMINCSMSVPLYIGEAHSTRFADFAGGVSLLEKAMAGCNKMVVYLEQIKGVYGSKVNVELIDDLIGRYMINRTKMFHLEKSWKRFKSSEINDVIKPKTNVKY